MTASSAHAAPAVTTSPRSALLLAVAMALAVIVLYALAGAATTLFDRDEPRFAQATVEMIAPGNGNWLYPTFAGELRPDKPILIYWLMSVPVRLVGKTEWAFRLPSAVGVGIAALATFLCARRFVSDRGALLAILVLVASPLTMMMGTAATADGWLLGMTTAALASFITALHATTNGRMWASIAMLALFCGLAQLTKGPVALAVVGFPVLSTIGFGWRHHPKVRRLAMPCVFALIISVGIFLAWAIPANAATQGEFASHGLGKHVVSRILAPMEGHGGNFFLMLPYYVPVILAGFFPWTLFLPAAIARLIKSEERTLRRVLFTWILPTFVMMSLVATKLPHYVLPIWPALAIAVTWSIERSLPAARLWRITGLVMFMIGALIGVAGFVAAPFLVPSNISFIPAWLAGLVFGGVCFYVYVQFTAARYKRATIFLATDMLAAQQFIAFGVLAPFERIKLPPRIADAIQARVPPETPVLAVRFGEPSLVYELWPQRVQIEGSSEATRSWQAGAGSSVLIAPMGELTSELRMPAIGSRFEMIAPLYGFNYSTGDWLWVAVIGRDLEPVSENAPRNPDRR